MAFVPDNSFDLRLQQKLPQILWEFYEYLCRKRNHESRLCFGTIDEFIALYGYKRASKFILTNLLKSTNWIGGTERNYELLVGDFSPVDKKADARKAQKGQSKKIDLLENESKNLDSESKKIDDSSKKIDSPYIRNLPASLPADNQQEENIHTAHAIVLDSVDFEHGEKINEILQWLRQTKNRKNLVNAEWLALFAELETEEITIDGFKDFYVWVSNQNWIVERKVTLTPNVMRREIEGYKNREHLENKRLINAKNGEQNGNGKSQTYRPNTNTGSGQGNANDTVNSGNGQPKTSVLKRLGVQTS